MPSENRVIRKLHVAKDDDLRTLYAKAKRAFTAEDLQRYVDIEPGIPAEDVLAAMAAAHKEEETRKRKRGLRKR